MSSDTNQLGFWRNVLNLFTGQSSLERPSLCERYLAGLTISCIAIPLVMVAVTIFTYCFLNYQEPLEISPKSPYLALVVGILGGIVIWFLLAIIAQYFTGVDRANPAVYRELRTRVDALRPQVNRARDMCKPEEREPRGEDQMSIHLQRCTTAEEMHIYLTNLQNALDDDALKRRRFSPVPEVRDWIQGLGYINLWKQIHRTEEMLLLFTPIETLIADAHYDQLRLQGSNIENSKVLTDRLMKAFDVFTSRSPSSLRAFQASDSPLDTRPILNEFEAREIVRHVRHTINEFRDERRAGLVRTRNLVINTITVTELVVFGLVALAILSGVTLNCLFAAITFFLTGAVVGLFNRLRLNINTEASTEDYGLATARLLFTPIFSGLAALVGVAIIPLLPELAIIPLLSESAMHAPIGPPASMPLTRLTELFSIHHTSSLAIAAIFGLSPTMLITRLQQRSEQYKTDLKSTGPATRR